MKKTVKVRMTEPVYVPGNGRLEGEVEVSEELARLLVRRGLAKKVKEGKKHGT